MPKWSEMLARLIPWLDTDDSNAGLREEVAETEREQAALAPLIADQTAYLEEKCRINGFSNQLRLGFEQRAAGQ